VIIDELHLIGDESRGYLLEILLTKLAYVNKTGVSTVQVIAMSATFPNLKEIALWLDTCLYITNFRPIEVKEYMKLGNELLASDGTTIVKKYQQSKPV